MNKEKNIGDRIKAANREVYNNKKVQDYNKNKSIFNKKRTKAYNDVFQRLTADAGKGMYLDVGTGTGNLLQIAQNYFDNCYAIDISEKLLAQIKPSFPNCCFAASDAETIPFKNELFNIISCNALLHHLYKHDKLFQESFRLLKEDGFLYTDHDPNYFFTRFYRIFYKLKYRNKPGFGSELDELAEYHNSTSLGINPLKLKKILLDIGFKDVRVIYRITDRPHWSGLMKISVELLKIVSKIIPAKTFYTHFSIIARK